MQETCYYCKFWNAPPKADGRFVEGDWAECRFDPPQVVAMADFSTRSAWPLTRAPQWCSRFARDDQVK